MNTETISTNPVVKAIANGNAPRPAKLAAARGALPISQNDLLEVLTFLACDDDAEIKNAALETFAAQSNDDLFAAVNSAEIAPSVLGFVAESRSYESRIYEAVITNLKTPDDAIVKFAQQVTESSLLELVTVNQQRLIRSPAILDAILSNSHSNAEATRRAKEIREEFFEKSRGAAQIAEELRVQGNAAAAEFLEKAEFTNDLAETESPNRLSIADAILLASHIEVPDSEVDDSWLDFDLIEDIYEESDETRRALAEKIIGEMKIDGDAIAPDRIALIRRIMLMGIKDRVKVAMKGDREARGILIRDPNKIVASAVLANSRITEQEVEKIAAMRTVPNEVLRSIGLNRNWARNYTIIHGLAKNPRTPLPTALTVLTRIQTKDLKGISQNRNVSEAIRKQAIRLLSTRK